MEFESSFFPRNSGTINNKLKNLYCNEKTTTNRHDSGIYQLLFIAEPALKVWKKDKSTVTLALSEQPVTTFSNGMLIIKTTSTTIEYPLADVLRYTYEGFNTGIDSYESGNNVVAMPVLALLR